MKGTSSFEKSMRSCKNGHHATVYDVQKDPKLSDKNLIRDKKKYHFPFVGGGTYKGEWVNDCKHGFGTMRGADGTVYEGDWRNNMKCGRGTIWRKRGKSTMKEYVGEWKDDCMHGWGTFCYANGDIYTGQFADDVKSGRGKYDYADGSKYEGEYENDQRCGFGTLYCANGDIYEGYWLNDQKEGPGKCSYLTTRKVYEGEWVNGQPKCGEYRSATTEELAVFSRPQAAVSMSAFNPSSSVKDESFALPELGLEAPMNVLAETLGEIAQDRDRRFGIAP